MEIPNQDQSLNKESNIHKVNNEDSILKSTKENDSGLIKNELQSSDIITEEGLDEMKPKKIQAQKCKLYLFVGRTLFLFLDKYSNPLFIIGPNWPMFICLISTLSLLMLFIFLKFWSSLGFYTKLFGKIIYFTFIISYTYTSLINPGYPRNTIGRSFGIPKNDYYFCEYCGFYLRKCSYGSHCDQCKICIEKYEHHCVWTGHCIGKNNKITFYIFLFSTFALIIYFGYSLYEGLSKSL